MSSSLVFRSRHGFSVITCACCDVLLESRTWVSGESFYASGHGPASGEIARRYDPEVVDRREAEPKLAREWVEEIERRAAHPTGDPDDVVTLDDVRDDWNDVTPVDLRPFEIVQAGDDEIDRLLEKFGVG